ncbi:LexA family protein [Photobacterium sp. GSS17]|uniref:LexA family protein n=1 Tax=Photobacterium TaxID=657 RepID=UPI0023605028|nr:LexA family transcriptional regulator [Photobacterium sp. GSS17]
MLETVGSRIRRLRKALGLTQKDVANYLKTSAAAVTQWENDQTKPNSNNIITLAKLLETTPEMIVEGKEAPKTHFPHTVETRVIPILSWVQAGHWTESCTAEELGDNVEWQETTAKVSANAFALKVRGDSMTNPYGSPSIPDGATVIIEPCPDPENGKIVVAMLEGSSEATLKKLEKDGLYKYLVPLNPKYEPMKINGNCRIIGYAKQIVMDL